MTTISSDNVLRNYLRSANVTITLSEIVYRQEKLK